MMIKKLNKMRLLMVAFFALFQIVANPSYANEDPAAVIEAAVNTLLDEFTESREQLEGDNAALFDLVDRVASPLFDFGYISKLVLGKKWKTANEQQRADFAVEFKRLLIVTYATALFKYTGDEVMDFTDTKIKEKKGVKSSTVKTEVTISGGQPIPVAYSLILNKGKKWKIYNLSVGDLNMVLNYRNVFQSAIQSDGIDGTIASMKETNDRNYL